MRDDVGNDLRARLERQLAELVDVERPRLLGLLSTVDGKDPADQADRAVRELELATLEGRVERLREQLDALDQRRDAVPVGPSGLAPGALLVLDFGDGPQTYRFADVALEDGVEVITSRSPLGQALSAAAPGQQVGFRTPRGPSQVTLVSVG